MRFNAGSWKSFDKYFREYDKWFLNNNITALNELKLLMTFKIDSPSLEIGVGTGYFGGNLGIEIGIDPSYNMLTRSIERGVDSVISVGEELPFRDKSFKTVLLIVTICFLSDPFKTLKEIYRILLDDGNLIVCTIPKDSSWGLYYSKLSKEGHKFYRYARFYSLKELVTLLTNTGFKVGNIRGTLSYSPFDKPYIEEPNENIFNHGFVCIENYKCS